MKEFCFKTHKGLLVCSEQNIIKITSISNYSKIFFDNNTTLVVAKVLKRFESAVTPGQFIRINQSVLFNVHHIKQIDLKNKMIVSLHNNETFTISKSGMVIFKNNTPLLMQPALHNKIVA